MAFRMHTNSTPPSHNDNDNVPDVVSLRIGHGSLHKLSPKTHPKRHAKDSNKERLYVPWNDVQPFESAPSEIVHQLDGYIAGMSKNKKLLKEFKNNNNNDCWNKHLNWATDQNPDGVPIVHPAIDQGPCGSCWALAATGSIEASVARNAAFSTFQTEATKRKRQHRKKHHTAVNLADARRVAQMAEANAMQSLNLSIQELLDCDTTVDQGCAGGNPVLAFHFIHRYGLVDSDSYPYLGREGTCQTQQTQRNDPSRVPIATVQSWVAIPTHREDLMEVALRFIGPIAVGFHGDSKSFLNYQGGIFDDPSCNKNTRNNHALLVVGYGQETVENSTVRYWIARNSWGTEWGENGFVRIRRSNGVKGYPGVCGIAANPSVAVGGRFISLHEQELLKQQGIWSPQDLEDPVFIYCKTKVSSLSRQKACLSINGIFTAYRAWFLGIIAVTFVLLTACPLTRDCRRQRRWRRKQHEKAESIIHGGVQTHDDDEDAEMNESTPLTVAGSYPPRYSSHSA